MILLAIVFVVVTALVLHHDRTALRAERDRVNGLLTLLEAKAAPAEHAAYLAPHAPVDDSEWVFSDDGLIGFRTEG